MEKEFDLRPSAELETRLRAMSDAFLDRTCEDEASAEIRQSLC